MPRIYLNLSSKVIKHYKNETLEWISCRIMDKMTLISQVLMLLWKTWEMRTQV